MKRVCTQHIYKATIWTKNYPGLRGTTLTPVTRILSSPKMPFTESPDPEWRLKHVNLCQSKKEFRLPFIVRQRAISNGGHLHQIRSISPRIPMIRTIRCKGTCTNQLTLSVDTRTVKAKTKRRAGAARV